MKKLYALFVFVACTASFQHAGATTWNINVQNFSFTGTPATVNVGDTVTWNWVGGTHTTTSTAVPTGAASWDHPINSGSTSFSYVVAMPGTYAFHCSFHGSMTGTFVAQLGTGVQSPVVAADDLLAFADGNGVRAAYTLSGNAHTRLTLTDLAGKTVYATSFAMQSAGTYNTTIPSASLPKGIYLVTLQSGETTATRKVNVN